MSSHDDPRRDAATEIDRRGFLQRAALGTAAVALGSRATLGVPRQDPSAVIAQIAKQHDTTLKALQDWIKLPSIAGENIGYPAGADYMARLARDAGFQQAEVIPTKGKPGVFATLDAGARSWLAIYFMYDVKQYDPGAREWRHRALRAETALRPSRQSFSDQSRRRDPDGRLQHAELVPAGLDRCATDRVGPAGDPGRRVLVR